MLEVIYALLKLLYFCTTDYNTRSFKVTNNKTGESC